MGVTTRFFLSNTIWFLTIFIWKLCSVHRKSKKIQFVLEPSVPPPLNDTAKGSVDVARVDSLEVRVIFSLLSCSRLREGRKMWATEFDWLYLEEASNKTRVKRIWVTAHFRVINELMTPSRHCTLDIWICHKKFLKELYEAEISNFMRFDLNQSWWKWCLKFVNILFITFTSQRSHFFQVLVFHLAVSHDGKNQMCAL